MDLDSASQNTDKNKNNLSRQRTNLAKKRTQLANQRTILAYMRTGFSIAAIAGTFKKIYLVYFGIAMILLSTLQYLFILRQIRQNTFDTPEIDYFPLVFVPLSFIAFYLQFYK